jgi:HTH-type transcriptional regulator, competence development regulator
MNFGRRIRDLRKAKNLGQRALGQAVGVSFTYISRIENEKLDFGDYPSEELILKLAKALDADAEELLVLAEKVPGRIRKRVLERPDAFGRLAELDDATLDLVVAQVENLGQATRRRRRAR